MRKVFWITLLGAAAISSSCVVPSLHPLFTTKDLVLEPQLEGAWHDEDGGLWEFARASGKSYRLTLEDSEELSRFDAHLLRLEEHLFLDLFPRSQGIDDTYRGGHFVPAHTFYKVTLAEGTVKITALDEDWLKEMKEKGSLEVANTEIGDELLLTAPTAELQKFIRKIADDPVAFPMDDSSERNLVLKPATI